LELQQLMGAFTEGTGRLPNSRFVQTLATYLQPALTAISFYLSRTLTALGACAMQTAQDPREPTV
jgi:hypothetical protein